MYYWSWNTPIEPRKRLRFESVKINSNKFDLNHATWLINRHPLKIALLPRASLFQRSRGSLWKLCMSQIEYTKLFGQRSINWIDNRTLFNLIYLNTYALQPHSLAIGKSLDTFMSILDESIPCRKSWLKRELLSTWQFQRGLCESQKGSRRCNT